MSNQKIIYNYRLIKKLMILIYMSDFWNNVSRYPRFFISSLAGLILIILAPLKNLFKIKKFRILVPVFILLFVVLIYNIILNMTGI
jgi:hypothetical protein